MFKKILVLISIIGFIFIVRAVSASETTSIMVYPTIQELKITPGINFRTQINFRNASDRVLVGNIKSADYEVIDKQGSIRIIEDGHLKPRYSASSWLTFSNDLVAIPKGETVTLNIMVNPPSDLTSCGYYALVYFQPLEKDEVNSLNVSTKIGSLFNFTVDNGKCREQLNIAQLNIPSFLENGPIPINFDLLNQGDIHVASKGFITATDMFGKFVDQQAIKEMKIFPEKEKEYATSIGKKWLLGRYKILVNISYGTATPQVTSKIAYVWVFPWRIFLLVLLSIVIIGLFIFNLYNMTKKGYIKEKSPIETLKEEINRRDSK